LGKADGVRDQDQNASCFSPVFARAVELFEGDRNAASEWMSSPLQALGGATPNEVVKTELGAHEIEKLIGRIEHGVYP
jgi:putative toxin-antitoxin system antitoxin component (TIGR02293 family)